MTDAELSSFSHLGDYFMILAVAGIFAAITWLFLND